MESCAARHLTIKQQFFMLNKQIICAALAVMFGLCTGAQNFGEIHGKVKDKNGLPLPGVVVIASNGVDSMGLSSDSDGKYRLKPLMPGNYTITTKMIGMADSKITGVFVNPDKITFVQDMVLCEDDNVLPAAYVDGGFKDKLINRDGPPVTVIRAKELKNMPSANGSGNLKGIVASLTSDVKPSSDGKELYFRGSRAGSVVYFIDGMKIRDRVPSVPSSGISSISVYTGGVPAKYGDATGGIVVVDTKNYLEVYYEKLNGL
jgi:hypothetical protein